MERALRQLEGVAVDDTKETSGIEISIAGPASSAQGFSQSQIKLAVKMTMAQAYTRLRDYDKAVQYLNEKYAIQEELKTAKSLSGESDRSITANNLGFLYSIIGDYVKAEFWFQKSIELVSDEESPERQANVDNLAVITDKIDYLAGNDQKARDLKWKERLHLLSKNLFEPNSKQSIKDYKRQIKQNLSTMIPKWEYALAEELWITAYRQLIYESKNIKFIFLPAALDFVDLVYKNYMNSPNLDKETRWQNYIDYRTGRFNLVTGRFRTLKLPLGSVEPQLKNYERVIGILPGANSSLELFVQNVEGIEVYPNFDLNNAVELIQDPRYSRTYILLDDKSYQLYKTLRKSGIDDLTLLAKYDDLKQSDFQFLTSFYSEKR